MVSAVRNFFSFGEGGVRGAMQRLGQRAVDGVWWTAEKIYTKIREEAVLLYQVPLSNRVLLLTADILPLVVVETLKRNVLASCAMMLLTCLVHRLARKMARLALLQSEFRNLSIPRLPPFHNYEGRQLPVEGVPLEIRQPLPEVIQTLKNVHERCVNYHDQLDLRNLSGYDLPNADYSFEGVPQYDIILEHYPDVTTYLGQLGKYIADLRAYHEKLLQLWTKSRSFF